MVALTKKERETLLILFKEYANYYNANSLSKMLKISHAGAQKILKRLLQENLVISKTIGKSIVYKINFQNNFACQLMTFLLADEADHFRMWKEEFKELFKKDRIILFFGSAVKNYDQAKDIDLMLVINKNDVKKVNAILKQRGIILPKKIHDIKLTSNDLLNNLKKKGKIMIDIISKAIVLDGQEKYVEILKDVTGF